MSHRETLCRHRGEGQIELAFPSEFDSGFGESIVPILRARMSLRHVRRVGRDFVGNHAIFDVSFVGRQPKLHKLDVVCFWSFHLADMAD